MIQTRVAMLGWHRLANQMLEFCKNYAMHECMALSLKNPEADRLVKEVRERTGESATQAVIVALRERLARMKPIGVDLDTLAEEILKIGERCARLPIRDHASVDQMLGYDEDGIPY